MSDFKSKWKFFWRLVKECVLKALTPIAMYFVAGSVMLLLQAKFSSLGATIAWAVVCGVVALAYNGVLLWIAGSQHYEMLVSGNMKRRSAMQMGTDLNISSYKLEKEYRPWKGFVIGAISALPIVIGSIVLGCNQGAVGQSGQVSKGLAVVILLFDLLDGWVFLPFQVANLSNPYTVSYFIACAFALLPVIVSGALYIGGAYGRRAKRLREQEIAARAAEAEANRPKKINYGGLPGTKPKKRR